MLFISTASTFCSIISLVSAVPPAGRFFSEELTTLSPVNVVKLQSISFPIILPTLIVKKNPQPTRIADPYGNVNSKYDVIASASTIYPTSYKVPQPTNVVSHRNLQPVDRIVFGDASQETIAPLYATQNNKVASQAEVKEYYSL